MTAALTTSLTKETFLPVFNRLCIALREQQDESGVTQGVYYEALRDLPLAILSESAAQLAIEPGRRFFPTTAEWRSVADRLIAAQHRLRADAGAHTWTVECTACDDTGWEYFECTGDDFCGRKNTHAKHSFVRSCPCRDTNRTYHRHNR